MANQKTLNNIGKYDTRLTDELFRTEPSRYSKIYRGMINGLPDRIWYDFGVPLMDPKLPLVNEKGEKNKR